MSKEEFLQRLSQALTGEVPQGAIQDNIRFYDDYIKTEVGKGVSEEAVTAEIGDPRLIAKTIIEAAGPDGGDNTSSESGYSSQSQQTRQNDTRQSSGSFHSYDMSKWYWKLLTMVVVVVVLFTVISIIGGLFSLIIPMFGPIVMVFVIMWLIKGRRR